MITKDGLVKAGTLSPGQPGFITIDAQGVPQEPTTTMPDFYNVPSARVVGAPLLIPEPTVTPSGAPVTTQMNPAPTWLDQAWVNRQKRRPG